MNKRLLRAVSLLVALVAMAALAPTARAALGDVNEFSVGTGPVDVITGPDGNLWYAGGTVIGRAKPDGVDLGTVNTAHTVNALAVGQDGNVWFTTNDVGAIGRITVGGTVTIFTGGITGTKTQGITAGPDGLLWFTEPLSDKIGRMTVTGNVTEFSAGISFGAKPYDITTGPDGNLWFTELDIPDIGRITPAGVVTEFSTFTFDTAITTGPDGRLWATNQTGNALVAMATDGTFTKYPLGVSDAQIIGIAAGQDGNLWVPDVDHSRIFRVTPSGEATEFTTGLTADAGMQAIAAGPDGNLWVGQTAISKLGRISPLDDPSFASSNTIDVPATGTSGAANPYPAPITVSGLSGTVTDLSVRLTGIQHTYPDDIDALLVGPSGQKVLVLAQGGGGRPGAYGTTINLLDSAPYSVPDDRPLVSGAYKPSVYLGAAPFPSPAPAEPYATTLAAFKGTNPNGEWDLYVVDSAANDVGKIRGGWSLDIDTRTPLDTEAGGAARRHDTPTYAFRSFSIGLSGFECSFDSAPFTTCASPISYPAAAEGTHNFEVRAVSSAHNFFTSMVDTTPATVTTVVDQTGPVSSITSGPVGSGSTATFQFSSADPNITSFECSVDAAAYAPCTSPTTYKYLSAAQHNFSVRGIDDVGNTGPAVSRTWSPDPPDLAITSGPADGGMTNDPTPSFAFSTTDQGAEIYCRMDTAPFLLCGSSYLSPTLSDGAHRLEVYSKSNNVHSTTLSRDFTVDTVGPTTTISAGPASGSTTSDRDPAFNFAANEPGSTFTCSLDGGASNACTSPMQFRQLANGSHTFTVQATDPAGNPGGAASRTWTVDATGPVVEITDGPAFGSSTKDPRPPFAFSSESNATFQCKLDSQNWRACSGPGATDKAASALSDGAHVFYVRAIDAAGNTGDPLDVQFTVDTRAPKLHITSGPAEGSTVSTPKKTASVTFEFTSPEDVDFTCRLDGGTVEACDGSQTYPALALGPHTFVVTATDAAGNPTAKTRHFTVAKKKKR